MAVSREILGMNARNFIYIRKYNSQASKKIADDKLETKKVLLNFGISTPKLLASFETRDEIRSFDWYTMPLTGFVIKPARGYGGAGILIVKKSEGDEETTETGKVLSIRRLESHLFDILEGAYSLQQLPDKAFIEERVFPHPFFRKIAPSGIADIRFIVFNRIPIMAMMRLPTSESEGKANLHQGAIGVGIDLRTGITTAAVYKNQSIIRFPETKMKLRGIKIPEWDKLLLLASRTQEAIGLGYAGIDIVFNAKRGPVVLEVNSRPGLSIQIANMSSLRTRLERIENMTPPSPERAVEVAKSLFAESFSEKVETAPKVLTVIQKVVVKQGEMEKEIDAKLDTGAYRTSVDIHLAKELGLASNSQRVFVQSAAGQHHRSTVKLTFTLAGRKVNSIASLADRRHMNYLMIIGRQDLKGFLIKPALREEQKDAPDPDDR